MRKLQIKLMFRAHYNLLLMLNSNFPIVFYQHHLYVQNINWPIFRMTIQVSHTYTNLHSTPWKLFVASTTQTLPQRLGNCSLWLLTGVPLLLLLHLSSSPQSPGKPHHAHVNPSIVFRLTRRMTCIFMQYMFAKWIVDFDFASDFECDQKQPKSKRW